MRFLSQQAEIFSRTIWLMSDNHESEGLVSTEHEAHEQLLSEDPSAYLGTLEQDGASLCEECLQYFLENISLADLEPEERTEVLVELAEYAEYNPALFNRLSPKLEDLSQEDIDTLAREEPGAAFSLFVEVSDDGVISGRNLGSGKFLPLEHIYRDDVVFVHNDSYFASVEGGEWEVIYQGGNGQPVGYRSPGIGDGLEVELGRLDSVEAFQRIEEEVKTMDFSNQVDLLLDIEKYLNEGEVSEALRERYRARNREDLLSPRNVGYLMTGFSESALFYFTMDQPEAAERLLTTAGNDGERMIRFFGNPELNSQLSFQHFLADTPENQFMVTERNGAQRYWVRTPAGYEFLGQQPSEPVDQNTAIGDRAVALDGADFRTISELPNDFELSSAAEAIIPQTEQSVQESELRSHFLVVQSFKSQATEEFRQLSAFAIENDYYAAESEARSGPYYEAILRLQGLIGSQAERPDGGISFREYLDGSSDQPFRVGEQEFAPLDFNVGTAEFQNQVVLAYEAVIDQFLEDLAQIDAQNPENMEQTQRLRSHLIHVSGDMNTENLTIMNAFIAREIERFENAGVSIEVDRLLSETGEANMDYLETLALAHPEQAQRIYRLFSLVLERQGMNLYQQREAIRLERSDLMARISIPESMSFHDYAEAYLANPEADMFLNDGAQLERLLELEAQAEDLVITTKYHQAAARDSTGLYQALDEGRENFVAEIQRRANTARYHQSVSETGALVIEKSAVSLAQVQQSQEGLVGLIDGDIERTDTGYRFRVKGSEEDAWIEANLQTDEMTPAKFLDSPYRQAFSAGIDSSNLPYMQILTTVGGESTFFPQATTEHDLTGLGGWELEKLFRNLYPIGRAELDGNTIAGWRRALEIYDGFPGLLAAVQSQGQSEQANLPDLVDERGNLHSENTRFYTIYFERILSGSRVTSMA